jgi:hypothetical protein
MTIINKIKAFLSPAKLDPKAASVSVEPMTMKEREKLVYDTERLRLQKLYEKWLCKETWVIQTEGIPLLLGINPDSPVAIDNNDATKVQDLWEHAHGCIQKNILSVINIEKPSGEWEIKPVELYRWATVSRVPVPPEFDALMGFVMQTVKLDNNPVHARNEEAHNAAYHRHREIVLGAAISLLINAPKQCFNNKGGVEIDKLTSLIMQNKAEWFGEEDSLLTESAITDLINDYIKMTRPVL